MEFGNLFLFYTRVTHFVVCRGVDIGISGLVPTDVGL